MVDILDHFGNPETSSFFNPDTTKLNLQNIPA